MGDREDFVEKENEGRGEVAEDDDMLSDSDCQSPGDERVHNRGQDTSVLSAVSKKVAVNPIQMLHQGETGGSPGDGPKNTLWHYEELKGTF